MQEKKESPRDPPFPIARQGEVSLPSGQHDLYAHWLRILNDTGIPYAVAGAFGLHAYTGIWRETKDLDVFIQPEHLEQAMQALAAKGFETLVWDRHWLAKIRCEPYFMDLLFGLGSGMIEVDADWMAYTRPAVILGVPIPLIAIEELIASKTMIAKRDRFDGADVVHLIHAARGKLDWGRLQKRLHRMPGLLLWHCVFFDLIYPGHPDYLPQERIVSLFETMRKGWSQDRGPRAFRGTLIDPYSFAVDCEDWGYEDARDIEPLVDERGRHR
ncbi:MAG: nucleotidyl transferase [bacterium]